MNTKNKVAYVVVCWNNQDLMKDCIDSILSQSNVEQRIIVVDNHSSDDTIVYLQKEYPMIELLEMRDNYGFAKGNNIGIAKALEDKTIDYIALINTDARIAEDWTSTIVDFANKKPKGAAFQTITLDYYDPNIIDSTHIYVAANGQATQGSWRRELVKDSDVAPYQVFGCNAAAVIYSRRFIEEQPFDALFDEAMFMYLEDVDVAARATVMGWGNYVVPGSRAYHMGSASSGKNPGFSLYMTFRNNTGLLIKNFSIPILVRILPKLIRGDIDTVRHLRRTNNKRAAFLVAKGRVVGVMTMAKYFGKRRSLSQVKTLDDQTLWHMMNNGLAK